MTATPLHIQILLHFYTSPGPFPKGGTVIEQILLAFHDEGILDLPDKEGVFVLSEKGKAWMEDILLTPLPKLAFIGRNGNVIKTMPE